MTEQFELGVGEKGVMIYDNDGPDDYYFIEDPKELQAFIKLINRQSFELKWYRDAYLEAHKLIMTSCSKYILPVVTDGVTIDHPVERDCVSVTIPKFELEPIKFKPEPVEIEESKIDVAKRLLEAIREVCPKCPECGADLSRYWNYDSQGREFQYCPKCRKLVKR